MDFSYRENRVELMPREGLEQYQLEALRRTVGHALRTRFYNARFKEAGISSPSDISDLSQIRSIPYTTKQDLRNAYPDGILSVDKSEVVRLHASSGTTGIPTVIYHTAADIDSWTELCARSIIATGASRSDVFQNMMTYGLFTGGLGLHYGAERAGLLVIPSGAGNTKRQFSLMADFGTTVVHATPSYMLHLFSKLEEENFAPGILKLRRAFVGAEPHSEDTRKKIERLFGIDVYNSYGLSEMNGPGVAFECQCKQGMHVWEDAYILEVVDPETGDTVADGHEGELVFTTLQRTATPLIRYRTRDLSAVILGPCPCGRTHRRIRRIKGRTDDMLIVNGVNIFPSQIENVLMRIPEIGTNYQIVIEKTGALDRITVKTEVGKEIFTDDTRDLNALKNRIQEHLKASILIKPAVELHEPGRLPLYEGKAKRVFDLRASDVD